VSERRGDGAASSETDRRVVAGQLGRPPRGRWKAIARCRYGWPQVIAVAPLLEDGTPFPTTFWLTCPYLVEAVSALESAGQAAEFTRLLDASPSLAEQVLDADAAYRVARAAANRGVDPCAPAGIAGQSDPLVVKCLHARVAAFLAGVTDPIGGATIGLLGQAGLGVSCEDDRCASLASDAG
jgi:uncharacterized protein